MFNRQFNVPQSQRKGYSGDITSQVDYGNGGGGGEPISKALPQGQPGGAPRPIPAPHGGWMGGQGGQNGVAAQRQGIGGAVPRQPGAQMSINGGPPVTAVQQGVKGINPTRPMGNGQTIRRTGGRLPPAAPSFDFSSLFNLTGGGGGGQQYTTYNPNLDTSFTWQV